MFLLVLLFNFCGYRFVLACLQTQNAAAVEAQVDAAKYTDADLVSVKTVLHLPYYSSSPEFERAYGSITINGTDYEYVKRRVYNDTLELLCLPNTEKTKLKQTSADLAKAATDAPVQKKAGGVKLSLPDFFHQSEALPVHTVALATPTFVVANYGTAPGHTHLPERPPQVNA